MYDYLIVGQGIAGTVLAHELLAANKQVLIVNDPSVSSASKVAAGLYNPVVFKRLAPSWNVDIYLPSANDFFGDLEKKLNAKFWHKKNIVRFFTEQQEVNLWNKKLSDKSVNDYLTAVVNGSYAQDYIVNSMAYAKVIQGGYLDMDSFLSSSEKYFSELNILSKEKVDYAKFSIVANGVIYGKVNAKGVVFCEGAKALMNPWFKHLPFKLTKGEVFTIRINDFKFDDVLNKNCFIVPLGNDLYKVGATYEWNELSDLPTDKGRSDLLSKLSLLLKIPFEIIKHEAGVRPTVVDRRPLLGTHPDFKQLHVFNGLGTKGVLMAPFLAKQFVNYLEGKVNLDKDVSIERFVI